jgi:hypothetical protein
VRDCGNHGWTRRHFLFGAAAGAASRGLLSAHPDAEVSTAPHAALRSSARACVFINLVGAPSQLDTFDPKDGPWNPPDADLRQYPGGLVLSRRYFPNLSNLTGDLLLIHSVQSKEAAHDRGQYTIQTAHSFNPALAPEVPHIGAVVSREKAGSGKLPPFLALNLGDVRGPAFLGGQYSPLRPFPNPSGIYTLQHNYYGSQSQPVFEDKFALLSALDAPLRQSPYSQGMADYTAMYTQAKGMMYDSSIDQVFRFSTEDQRRYGSNSFGDSLLTARNAIRAKNGAVFITAGLGGWDQHFNMFDPANGNNYYRLNNILDTALASLILDLKASGDLASTLIVVMGEFGRTPGALNPRDGRDHFKDLMSAMMIGGGVRGGRVLGVTDGEGRNIVDPGWSGGRAIAVEDLMATMYSSLGIDYTRSITDTPSGRRYAYIVGADLGFVQSVDEVFG